MPRSCWPSSSSTRKTLRGEPPPMRGACPARASAYATAPRATATSGLALCSRCSGSPRQVPSVAARRAVRASARKTPPLSRSVSGTGNGASTDSPDPDSPDSGRASACRDCAACCARNAAMCRVIAGSLAYGSPNSTMPPRARPGRSFGETAGKNPSTMICSISCRETCAERAPPTSFDPAPSSVIDVDSGASAPSSCSLAARQRSTSCEICPAESRAFAACPTIRPSTRCASARSMLSPPSIRWLPTPMRVKSGSPSCISTLISVRSVVPPPTSQMRTRRVARSSSSSVSRWWNSQS